MASDGLQFLSDTTIADVLTRYGDGTSHDMSDALMGALTELADPAQDNISLALVQVKHARASAVRWQPPIPAETRAPEPLLLQDPVHLPESADDPIAATDTTQTDPETDDADGQDLPDNTSPLLPASAAE